MNIKVVSKKSSPSTASDATTTVRVVARETPSGVGCASFFAKSCGDFFCAFHQFGKMKPNSTHAASAAMLAMVAIFVFENGTIFSSASVFGSFSG